MEIVRGRDRDKLRQKNCLQKRLCLIGGVFLAFILVVTLALSPKVALANADDELKAAVYKFKTAEKVRACKSFMARKKEAIELSETILNEENDDRPYDEGEGNGRKRVKCDVLYLANADGHGDYFGKYLSDHAKLGGNADGDESKISKDNQVVLADVSNTTVQRVKDKLGQNDLRSLMARPELMAEATESYPYHQLKDLGQAAEAQMYKEIAETYCTESHPPFTEAQDGNFVYVDKGSDGKYTVKRGYFSFKGGESGKGRQVSVWPAFHPQGEPDMSCWDVVQRYSDRADAYAAALNKHIEEKPGDTETTPTDETDDEKDKCNAGFFGFGFLLCPGQNLLNLIIDFLYGIIENILDWRLLETSGSQIKSYWEKFLSIANVILVIAFLIIIYSTATSDGLSNYDVKKMLPRIVILAIVINISFYVCAAIVDLCNIAGRGVMALLISTSPGGEGLGLGEKIGTVVSNVATGVAGGIAGVVAGVILFVSIGPPAVLALIVIILALIFRGVALTMMVIISPIAIALYLFPSAAMNKWHVKWRDAFIKMLLVYPMFMAVWGGSKLISSVTASTQNPIIGFITSLICTIAPAVAIIPLFKMSGDVMGKATAAIAGSKLANSAATGIHGAVSKSRPMRRASNIMPNALQAAQNRFGDTPLIGGVLRSDGVNKAISAADKQYNELDKQAMENANDKISRMNGGQLQEAFLGGTVDGNQITDTHTMRAIIAKQAPNATMEQAQQSMQSVNARANWLQEHGREREANELRRSYADAMIENGKSGISATTLNNWADTGWSNNDFDANYSNAISNYVSGMSASAVSSTSAGDMEHIQDTLNHAVARGAGAAAVENARQNLAAQSSAVLNNEDMRSKMSNTSIEVLRENTLLRNNASQATTTRFNLDSAGSNIDRQTRARFLNGAGSVGGYTPRRNRTNSNTPHGTTADRSAPSPDARWDRRR